MSIIANLFSRNKKDKQRKDLNLMIGQKNKNQIIYLFCRIKDNQEQIAIISNKNQSKERRKNIENFIVVRSKKTYIHVEQHRGGSSLYEYSYKPNQTPNQPNTTQENLSLP